MHNCPFYGRYMAFLGLVPGTVVPFNLIRQGGNQCALIADRQAPCREQMAERPVDWRTCARSGQRVRRVMRAKSDQGLAEVR
jgi:hypothetical protein